MIKEIKNIIEDLKFCDSVFDYTLSPDDCGLLLGYIEELQQENQQLKEQLDKATKQSVADHKYASECEDRVITYKSVLDEIREKIEFAKATIEYGGDYSDVGYNFLISAEKIVEILNKVKEWN